MTRDFFPIEQSVKSVCNSLKHYTEIRNIQKFLILYCKRHVQDEESKIAMERDKVSHIIRKVKLIETERLRKMEFTNKMKEVAGENFEAFSEDVRNLFNHTIAILESSAFMDKYFAYVTIMNKYFGTFDFISKMGENKNILEMNMNKYLYLKNAINYKKNTTPIKEQVTGKKLFLCKQCNVSMNASAKKSHLTDCYRRRKSLNNSSLTGGKLSTNSFNVCIFKDADIIEGHVKSPAYSNLNKVKPTDFMEKLSFKRRCIGLNRIDAHDCSISTLNFVQISSEDSTGIFYALVDDTIPPGCVAFHDHGLLSIKAPDSESFSVKIEPLAGIYCAKEITLECTNDSENSPILLQLIEQYFANALLDGSPIVFEKGQIVKFTYMPIEISFNIVSIFGYPSLDNSLDSNMYSLPSDGSAGGSKRSRRPMNDPEEIEELCVSLSQLLSPSIDISQNVCTPITQTGTQTPKRSKNPGPKRLSMTKSNKRKSKELKRIPKNIKKLSGYFYVNGNTKFNFIWKNINEEASHENVIAYYNSRSKAHEELERFLKMQFDKLYYNIELHSRGILVIGLPGTGKTVLVNEICKKLCLPLCTVDVLNTLKAENSIAYIEEIYHNAKCGNQWSVLLFDEIDVLSKFEYGDQYANTILRIMDEIKTSNLQVIVIGTTDNYGELHLDVRNSNYFRKEIIIHTPDVEERMELFMKYMPNPVHYAIEEFSLKTNGFTPRDIKECISIAYSENLFIKERSLIPEDVDITEDNLKFGIKIISKAKEEHSVTIKQTKWEHIYGYDELKKKFKEMITSYRNDPESHSFKSFLLYGPPGCSKTMFVRAFAQESGFVFISVRCSDLLSKYVGESEKSFDNLFNKAKMAAPAIIFLDEIDSLCSARSDLDAAWFVSSLKTLMANSNQQNKIIVAAATNRPHVIDESLFSPDCFAWSFHVNLPDGDSRRAMWKGILTGIPTEGNIDYEELTEKTKGFSGAEIQHIYQVAGETVADQYITCLEIGQDPPEPVIKHNDLIAAVNRSLPRTSTKVICSINTFANKHKI